MDQGEFMRAQLNYFVEHGIDPDSMTREELASTSIAFREKYEAETSKDNHTVATDPSR